ncbi:MULTISPECIES: signal recognition particle-docking protein FtsY [unclassified Parvimonas]|uniref:signal recognition particle-docking protein FtsY n=1 Tax=unclassified Parvimonas TaxID=1151464 RepID=UPI002B4A2C02|nr:MULTISPECIES: signal recognition particle-docking protein FtsY [unclassified Parvimonas]MEB3024701.1 signal recognition particle-docking protein FtsY [Parvimonas sp. M13]MEB3088846.1 signal recognition particle-docking protein FtsY [Parvimonas sp. M20]
MFNFFGKKKEDNELEEVVEKKQSFFERLKKGLTNTRNNLSSKIDNLLSMSKKIDEELFEELEYILVSADIGANVTMELIDDLKEIVKKEKITEPSLIKDKLIELMNSKLASKDLNHYFNIVDGVPTIILVVGVNGVGKTTSIGKLANKFKSKGKSVMLVAADTFRAAATEQLTEWANRSGVPIISNEEGADPASVVYDGIQSAKSKNIDILICDTAGRLHNKKNLMNELNKIARVIDREYPEANKEVTLVLDATTGQNAITQAKEFRETANIDGVILTKLDGTAKGGVVFTIQLEMEIPVKQIGIGEQIDDLQDYNNEDFVNAIFN